MSLVNCGINFLQPSLDIILQSISELNLMKRLYRILFMNVMLHMHL